MVRNNYSKEKELRDFKDTTQKDILCCYKIKKFRK